MPCCGRDLERGGGAPPLLRRMALSGPRDNYFPIASKLFFPGMVLEHVVVGQLQMFLEDNNYLVPFTSGFRLGFGTEMALGA